MRSSVLSSAFRPRPLALALSLATLGASAWAQTPAAGEVFHEDFGDHPTRVASPFVPQFGGTGGTNPTTDYYAFGSRDSTEQFAQLLLDGYYAVVNPNALYLVTDPPAEDNKLGDWWKRGTRWTYTENVAGAQRPMYSDVVPAGASTPDGWRQFYPGEYKDASDQGNGAVLVVNAGNVKNDIYRRLVTVEPGKTYAFSTQVLYVQSPGELKLMLRKADNSDADFANPLGSSPLYTTADRSINGQTGPAAQWDTLQWKFTIPAGCAQTNYAVAVYNNLTTAGGNDLFLDNVILKESTADPDTPEICDTSTPGPKLALVKPQDDSKVTAQNTAVSFTVTDNDQVLDENGAVITTVALGKPETKVQPQHGSLVQNDDGSYTYTPNTDWFGTDSFTYQVCTITTAVYPSTSCKPATVTITVVDPSASNVTVTANDKTATTEQNKPVEVPLLDDAASSDPTGAPLQTVAVEGSTKPQHGTVSFDDNGKATYTPNADFVGEDTFSYQACTQVLAPYTESKCTEKLVTVTVTGAGTVQPPAATPQPVPANSGWAVVMAALALAGAALRQQRRQGKASSGR